MPFEVLGKRHIGELFDNKLKVLIRTSPVKPRFITISAKWNYNSDEFTQPFSMPNLFGCAAAIDEAILCARASCGPNVPAIHILVLLAGTGPEGGQVAFSVFI